MKPPVQAGAAIRDLWEAYQAQAGDTALAWDDLPDGHQAAFTVACLGYARQVLAAMDGAVQRLDSAPPGVYALDPDARDSGVRMSAPDGLAVVCPGGRRYYLEPLVDGGLQVQLRGGLHSGSLAVRATDRQKLAVYAAAHAYPPVHVQPVPGGGRATSYSVPGWCCRMVDRRLQIKVEAHAEEYGTAYRAAAAKWKAEPSLDNDPPPIDQTGSHHRATTQIFTAPLHRRVVQ